MYKALAFVFTCLLSAQLHATPASVDKSKSIQPRIIGGTTSVANYSWMVSIKQDQEHFCGGVLIHQYYVLTAAHCLQSVAAQELTLVIGSNDHTQFTEEEMHSAQYFINHEGYNIDTFKNDIAVIRLSSPSNKTPINLLSTHTFSSNIVQKSQLTVMGWGVTDEDDFNSAPTLLRQVALSYQDQDVCEAAYSDESPAYWDSAFCAGEVSGGKDSCYGDSGGPMVIKVDDQWHLAGLVSWGNGCALAKAYGVYTKTSAYLDWIEQRLFSLSLLGESKIGFVAYERSKVGHFSLINNSPQDITINNHYIEANSANAFEVDAHNWPLNNNVVPANSQCDFTVNALGNNIGQQDTALVFEYIKGESTQQLIRPLNSKVLSPVLIPAADLPWPFFSGTKTQNLDPKTEHSEPWYGINHGGDVVLSSGNIAESERSILLTYLNGPQAQENLYLKFDAKISTLYPDYLIVTLNEQFYNPQSLNAGSAHTLLDATALNQWFTYGLPLQEGLNHVMFLFLKDGQGSGGNDQALINNFRICTTLDNNEENCSSASGFYNNKVITQLDDPQPEQTLTCTINEQRYAFKALVETPKIETEPPVTKRKGSSGSLDIFCLIFLSVFLLYTKPRRNYFSRN